MDFSPIIEFLSGLHPVVPVILAILGMLVVVAQVLAPILGAGYGSFIAKVLEIPVLGALLKALEKFAPLQTKASLERQLDSRD